MSKNNFKYITTLLFLICLLGLSSKIQAQSGSTDSLSLGKTLISPANGEVYDTQETISYLGGRMFFQLKKRLHLTDEEDERNEEKEKEKAKKAKFTVFGIKVEKH